MTIDQITTEIQPFKAVSRRQVIRYLNDAKIKPLGIPQRPQPYPENSLNRILIHLGIVPPVAKRFAADASSNGTNGAARGIPSMKELRAERKKGRVGSVPYSGMNGYRQRNKARAGK